jgi:hypothetical protein
MKMLGIYFSTKDGEYAEAPALEGEKGGANFERNIAVISSQT